MAEDLFTVDELAQQGVLEEDAEDYYRRMLFRGGHSSAEINNYFSGDNDFRQVYQSPMYQHLRKPQRYSTPGVFKYLQYGFQTSALGLSLRDTLPDAVSQEQVQNAGWLGRLAMGIGNAAGDAPAFLPSIVAGVGTGGIGAVGVSAATFAALSGYKEARMYDLMRGAGYAVGDNKWDEVTKAAVQGGILGMAMPIAGRLGAGVVGSVGQKLGKVGAISKGTIKGNDFLRYGTVLGEKGAGAITAGRMGGEITSMATLGPMMEGRVPELQDFVDNAAFMIGWHGMNKVGTSALKRIGVPNLIHNQMKGYSALDMDMTELTRLCREKPQDFAVLMSKEGFTPEQIANIRDLRDAFTLLEHNGEWSDAYRKGSQSEFGSFSADGMTAALIGEKKTGGLVDTALLPPEDAALLRRLNGTETIKLPGGKTVEVINRRGMEALHLEQNKRVEFVEKRMPKPEEGQETLTSRERVAAEGVAPTSSETDVDTFVPVSGERGNLSRSGVQDLEARRYAAEAEARAQRNQELRQADEARILSEEQAKSERFEQERATAEREVDAKARAEARARMDEDAARQNARFASEQGQRGRRQGDEDLSTISAEGIEGREAARAQEARRAQADIAMLEEKRVEEQKWRDAQLKEQYGPEAPAEVDEVYATQRSREAIAADNERARLQAERGQEEVVVGDREEGGYSNAVRGLEVGERLSPEEQQQIEQHRLDVERQAMEQDRGKKDVPSTQETDQVYAAANREPTDLREALRRNRDVTDRVRSRLETERLAEPIAAEWEASGLDKDVAYTASMIFAKTAQHLCELEGITAEEYIRRHLPEVQKLATEAGNLRGNYYKGMISLFNKADNTTIFHEMSHFWLERLLEARGTEQENLANRLVNRLLAEYNTDIDTIDIFRRGDKFSAQAYRDFQERFAKDFEAYLRDGKVASPEMKSVFDTIRGWFREIYQTVGDILGLRQHNPRMDKFFNDMLFGENRGFEFTERQDSLFNRALDAYRQHNTGKLRREAGAKPVARNRGGIEVVAPAEKTATNEGIVTGAELEARMNEWQGQLGEAERALSKARAEHEAYSSDLKKKGKKPTKQQVDALSKRKEKIEELQRKYDEIKSNQPGLGQEAADDAQVLSDLSRRIERGENIADAVMKNSRRIGELAFGSYDKLSEFVGKHSGELSQYRLEGERDLEPALGRFLRDFISNPDKAVEGKEGLYHGFMDELRKNSPELADSILNSREVYREQTANGDVIERNLNKIVSGEDKEPWSLLRLVRNWKETWQSFSDRILDKTLPVLRKIKYARELGVKEADAWNDAYIALRNFAGVGGKATHMVEFGTFDWKTMGKKGEPLKNILTDVQKSGGDFRKFSLYLHAARTVELRERPKPIKTGIALEDAKEIVSRLEGQYKGYAERLYKFQDDVLQYFTDAQNISPQAADLMRALNKSYVPFHRALVATEENTKSGKGVWKMEYIEGGSAPIYDPLESIVINTHAMVTAAERNHVHLNITNLAKAMEGKKLGAGTTWCKRVKEVPQEINVTKEDLIKALGVDPAAAANIEALGSSAAWGELANMWKYSRGLDRNNNIIVYRNGVAEKYWVAPEIGEILNEVNQQNVGLLMKLLGAGPAGWLRKGAVLTPDFWLRNIIRDTVTTALTSRHGFIPGWDTMRGLYHVVKKDEVYQQFLRSGGAQSCFFSMDRSSAYKSYRMLVDSGFTSKSWNVVKNPLEMLMALSETTELATRVGDFSRGMRADAGESMQAKYARSGFNTRDNLDFARMGMSTKGISKYTAFFNASVQGVDRMARAAIENPKAFIAKASLLAASSALLALSNYEDEDVREVPKSQRDMFWIIPMGEGDAKVLLRIPKPFEAGVLFASTIERTVEACLDISNEKNNGDVEKTLKDAYKDLGGSIVDAFTPSMIPTAAVPVIENWANRSLWSGRPIVPAYLEQVLPEEQGTDYNTQLTKQLSRTVGQMPGLGDMLSFSPAKAENMVRGWTGGLGMYALQLIDYGARKAGLVPDLGQPERHWTEAPVAKAFFMRHESMSKQSIFDLEEYAKECERFIRTRQMYMRAGNVEGADELGPYVALQPVIKARDAVRKAGAALRMLRNRTDLSLEERRKISEVMIWQTVQMARYGNMQYEQIMNMIHHE